MTFSKRWIARFSLSSISCIVLAGCSSRPQAIPPGESGAVLASERITPTIDDANAAKFERIERHANSIAQTIGMIDAARDVTLNNMQNAETQAFKASRALIGADGRLHTDLDLTEGSLASTGGNLDIAIQGAGYIPVRIRDSLGGTGYTRAGNLTVNNAGELVVAIGDGYKLFPPITIPTTATNLSIGSDGTVQYVKAGSTVKTMAGQIKLAMFPNAQGLNLLGGSIFTQSEASGPAVLSVPGEDGTGQIISGFLEESNVDLTRETLRLQSLNEWRKTMLRAAGIPD